MYVQYTLHVIWNEEKKSFCSCQIVGTNIETFRYGTNSNIFFLSYIVIHLTIQLDCNSDSPFKHFIIEIVIIFLTDMQLYRFLYRKIFARILFSPIVVRGKI